MPGFFVSNSDTFEIVVYSYVKEEELIVSASDNDMPADTEPTAIKVVFRKPTNKDAVMLSSSSIKTNLEGNVQIDITKMQDYVMRNLIVSWNLKDENDQLVTVNQDSIDKLNPTLARVIAGEALNKIKL